MTTVLFVHPSPDLYGSDLQLLESVCAVIEQGYRATVVLPSAGPLVDRLEAVGATVEVMHFPVLRKAVMTPVGIAKYLVDSIRSLLRMRSAIARIDPIALYVNTITIPAWILAGRLSRRYTVCHVHEVIDHPRRMVRMGLAAPLRLASRIVCNSEASRRSVCETRPLAPREIDVVYNGVRSRDAVVEPARYDGELRIVLVGRIAPRKGTDLAVDALALVRQQGVDARLTLCGDVFPGYEWYEQDVRERAEKSGVGDFVDFLGYVSDTGVVLRQSNIAIVPSRQEPFGNVAVEAMLASRLVIAADVQGLLEIIDDGRTGLLFRAGDPDDLARQLTRVHNDEGLAEHVVEAAASTAGTRFSVERYRRDIVRSLRLERRPTLH
ncbi:glycosyl transferase [Rhodococcoides trifolii]|uniref:Glycosyl transferase n=1 Tax=Rhodococcoides trifolii TaxID=908250 RepID=A0A917G8R3_9NOCA|nr:glycosyltransferase family 4 protein [Rhodococcus trifolii]GGG29081.1 glycosyl transferase [Rhodococcus trifolii]